MREVKYRLWCKESEEFRELVKLNFENGKLVWISCIDHDSDFEYFPEDDDHVLIEYTGLKDKNGREIYESDILKDHGDEGPIYVEYSDEHAGFIFVDIFDPSGREVYTPMQISYETFEVIGNLYEDPELLEETK